MKADQERLKQLDAGLAETREDMERLKQRLEDLESDMKRDKKGEEVSQNKVFFCSLSVFFDAKKRTLFCFFGH